jgi:predicted NAD-dependent protein-ADP-ribosyltransferase YbiA (DUF1768 family)
MNIKGDQPWPAGALSNFAGHHFVFDGVECASMEGLLQSFKFDKFHIQREVCKLVGLGAKKRGAARNKAWQREQKLWWREVAYKRDSDDYQRLLDRAFKALATNEKFRKALIATGDAPLTHSIGKRKQKDTVLTEAEFCSRLVRIRAQINNGEL